MATEDIERSWQLLVDRLKTEWHQLRPRHERVCELAYQLWQATPRNGCAGKLGATLDQIGLRRGTFYSWVKEHRIRIGEIPDDDVTEDPGQVVTDEPEPEIEDDAADDGDDASDQGGANGKKRPKSAKDFLNKLSRKTYTLSFEGAKARKFQHALTELRQFHPWGTDETAIYHSVIMQAQQLTLPRGNKEGMGEAA